jgi:fatty acid desaturase
MTAPNVAGLTYRVCVGRSRPRRHVESRNRCGVGVFVMTAAETQVPSKLDVVSTSAVGRGSAYAELSRDIRSAGLLARRPGYYSWKIALTVGLWLAGGVAFVLIGDSWWQLVVAACFGVIFTQLGFLGHDAGHRQIFSSRSGNYVLGVIFANVMVGLSYGWWVDKHNRHHAHPNDAAKDPDVGAGALIFTAGQAHASRGLARRLYRFQAYLFFPLLLLEAINLRVASGRYLVSADNRYRNREALLLGVHVAVYLSAVFFVLSPVTAIAFIAVHQGIFGVYLGCSFAPNHKGMPELSAADDADYLRRQVLTSRNVRGHWLTDAALGGLNYQIEHHLFPSMPRPNLRHAQRLVRNFCDGHDVSYLETSLIRSYAQALHHLDTIGRTTRACPTG